MMMIKEREQEGEKEGEETISALHFDGPTGRIRIRGPFFD